MAGHTAGQSLWALSPAPSPSAWEGQSTQLGYNLCARQHKHTREDRCNEMKNKLAHGELGVIDNQLVTARWMGPVPTEFLNSFFNRKAKLISIFAKQFNWKRKKHQVYRLFIQMCSSLKSTYYLHAFRWVTSVLLRLESEQIEEPNLFQSSGEQAVAKDIA